jgi:exonuclease V gamma subunit
MSRPLLLLPESGGAWLKACYDAEKDVMLMDEETQQKARSKFLQVYEGTWWSAAKVPMSGISACGARWSRLL